MTAPPLPSRISRRRWLAAAAAHGVALLADSAAATPPETVDVWVDLDEPVPAGAADAAARSTRAARVAAQQDRVMHALTELGAVELARVRHVRNAIAARIPVHRIDAVRSIAGVVRVRPVAELHPPRTTPASPP